MWDFGKWIFFFSRLFRLFSFFFWILELNFHIIQACHISLQWVSHYFYCSELPEGSGLVSGLILQRITNYNLKAVLSDCKICHVWNIKFIWENAKSSMVTKQVLFPLLPCQGTNDTGWKYQVTLNSLMLFRLYGLYFLPRVCRPVWILGNFWFVCLCPMHGILYYNVSLKEWTIFSLFYHYY